MKKLTITILVLLSLLFAMPVFSQVDDGYPLPFLEQWNSGTFWANNWQPEAENWSINGNEGFPSPCAEFTWDPIQNDYSISLESDQFQAEYITEGRIYLDFDIKLDDFNGDGLEKMKVQVWNWNNQVWTTVSTYSNDDGDFDWASEHLDITNLAKGKVFKIRFITQGENSLHIVSWFIDNIHLYRECEGVNDLTVECDTNLNTIVLHWNGSDNSDEWIHWDDEINYTAIGIASPEPFDIAARWEPEQLSGFEGSSITQIAFFPNEESSTYRVRVWIGELAENLIVDQEVISPVIGEWNTITLETPVPVDITQELWIGYQNDGEYGYQMGVDDGPAIDGYGNMINFGGWQTLLEINPFMDYNWNIAAHLVTITGESILLNKGIRELMGYNVYRSIDGGEYVLWDYISGITYTDPEEFIIGTLYCFIVTAVYESETDQCESNFSNEACVVCGIFVPEEKSQLKLKIYPNPASEVLYIESPEKIERVSILDCRGITIEQSSNRTDEQTNGRTGEQARDHVLKIPLNGLAPGLYLVRVETGGGMVARKVVVK
ncbi:MAG: T9SS type A sorting domain-containing protein [Bacteroidales bacterium]|nr:T9SS type A sorting domain-containing protein [Bacteroidales bacterium]